MRSERSSFTSPTSAVYQFFGHAVLDDAAVRDDVRAVLGERARDVLEEPRAIPRVDGDLDEEPGGCASLPLDRGEALGVALERAHVGTVLPVHGDAATHRDVADDLVARDRRAALREADEHVLDADDVDADAIARDRLPRT